MKKELKRIFNYYKKKYNLKTRFIFNTENDFCSFDRFSNIIYYNLYFNTILNGCQLKDKIIVIPSNIKEFETIKKYALIWALLHEIKHAIDYTHFNKRWNKEMKKLKGNLYWDNLNYRKGLSFEKRADRFAKKELGRI